MSELAQFHEIFPQTLWGAVKLAIALNMFFAFVFLLMISTVRPTWWQRFSKKDRMKKFLGVAEYERPKRKLP